MAKVEGTKVITGVVRLSYPHLHTPKAIAERQEAKYSCCLLISKSDTETLEAIHTAMEKVKSDYALANGGKKLPVKHNILRDGDAELAEGTRQGEEYAGHYFINASSKKPVKVIDKAKNDLTAEQVYGGCYVKASINFFHFDKAGNKGIACGLNGILKTADGEPFSASGFNINDFSDDFNEDDDDF